MPKKSKNTKATHATRPKVARLETPKAKPAAKPTTESARPAALPDPARSFMEAKITNTQEAPEPSAGYWQILKNFRAATEAMIGCDKLPDHSRDAILRMMGEFNQAPAVGSRSRRIFKNFRDATVALLEYEDLPEGVHTAITRMVDEFGNECGGNAAIEDGYARMVISRVFDLDDEDEEEAQAGAPATQPAAAPGPYKEICAEQFTLVDADGAAHATLRIAGGGAVLTMRDSQGRPRIRLRAGDKEAMITICGERGAAGKGVLPADDEVERVKIGYEPDDLDPYILINDGNEHECARLSLYGADGDGFIRLINPADGGYTIIDSDGLIACDGNDNARPEHAASEETAARPAAAPEPTTIAAADRNGAPREAGDEAVRDLVSRFLTRDDDGAAKAFIKLIHLIAYNDDRVSRDSIAMYASDAAYQRTMAYSDVAGKFFDEETTELSLRAA